MKSTLEFNLPEEQEELKAAIQGPYLKALIDLDIWTAVFRPGLKYNAYSRGGVTDNRLNEILDSKDRDVALEVIELLGDIFHQVTADVDD